MEAALNAAPLAKHMHGNPAALFCLTVSSTVISFDKLNCKNSKYFQENLYINFYLKYLSSAQH